MGVDMRDWHGDIVLQISIGYGNDSIRVYYQTVKEIVCYKMRVWTDFG